MVDVSSPTRDLPRAGFGLGLSAAIDDDGRLDRAALRAAIETAERAGMAGIWVPENVLATKGDLDPLVLLGWVAAITEQIVLGTAVLLLPYQHPYRLAQRLAALDLLSGGRLIVGVGLGGDGRARSLLRGESTHLGAEYELDIAALRRLLRGEVVHTDRPGWPAGAMRLDPLPATPGGPPLWMGAGAKPALERVARMAAGWIASGSLGVDAFTEQLGHLRTSILRSGRSFEDVVVAKRVYLCVDDDGEVASGRMRDWFGETWGDERLAFVAGVSGSPADCAAWINDFLTAGAELLILDPVVDPEGQTKRIVAEVLPLLAG